MPDQGVLRFIKSKMQRKTRSSHRREAALFVSDQGVLRFIKSKMQRKTRSSHRREAALFVSDQTQHALNATRPSAVAAATPKNAADDMIEVNANDYTRQRHENLMRMHHFVFHPDAEAARTGTKPAELAVAAGLRSSIEACFLRARNDLGLESRSWLGRHRHVSLVMAAVAFLAQVTAEQRRAAFGKQNETSPGHQTEAA